MAGAVGGNVYSGAGNDTLSFTGGFTGKLDVGSGNNLVTLGTSVIRSDSSLTGGSGNDSFAFGTGLSSVGANTAGFSYFYQGGVDSFTFASNGALTYTQASGTSINFYYDSAQYTSVTTTSGAVGSVTVQNNGSTIASFTNIFSGSVVVSGLNAGQIAAVFS